jgi:predicted dehydrogenase
MTYKVGIVGAGFGVRVHLPALVAHPKYEVVAIASPNSAERIAKERNIPHAFKTCEEMLRRVDVDIVDVTSPPFAHHEDFMTAIAAGKHVICEKPFALTVAQAEEMLAAAQRSGKATAVMHEFRWIPQRIALKELIDNGHLAPLRELEFTQLSGFLRADALPRARWWWDCEKGGGIAGAWLSHVIDSANWFAARPPIRVTGFVRTANTHRRDEHGDFIVTSDDGAFTLLDYGDGLVARLTADGTARVDSSTYAVHAENRTAVASGTGVYDNRLFSVDDEETAELQCAPSPYAQFESIDPQVPLVMQVLDEFAKQIETGQSAVPTVAEAVETQRVLAAIGFGPSSST